MSMRKAIAGALLVAAGAHADVITPDNKIVITFQTAGEYNLTPDLMNLHFGLTETLAPLTGRVASVYDGDTLLGTHDSSGDPFGNYVGPLNLDPSNTFTTPGNVYQFLDPAEMDFASIQDGSIDGRVEYSVLTGAHDVPLNQIHLVLGQGAGPSSYFNVNPAPTITSIEVVPVGGCAADCNGDGALNVLDFVCFQGEWQGQTEAGDCNDDGVYNVLDFVCYQGVFQEGCP